MTLKDLTAEKHKQAESTPFMQAVFARTLPFNLWVDWTYQKWLFYGAIEGVAGSYGLLRDLPNIHRTFHIFTDWQTMRDPNIEYSFRPIAIDYYRYLISINDIDKIMAHLYTWHMGDMFGGQMIKKIVPGSHRSLEFENTAQLIQTVRSKLNDNMAEEANLAFDWAIRMMRDYDSSLAKN